MFKGFAEKLAVRAITPVLHLRTTSNLTIRGFDDHTQILAFCTDAKIVLAPPKELILMTLGVDGVFDAPAEMKVNPAAPMTAQTTTRVGMSSQFGPTVRI